MVVDDSFKEVKRRKKKRGRGRERDRERERDKQIDDSIMARE